MNTMAKKLKIGSVEFIKTTGHDDKLNVNFRSLTTKLDNGNTAEFKSLNSRIYISEKPVMVIITIYDQEGKDVGQMYLSQSQSPETYLNLVDEFNKDLEKMD